MKKLSIFAFLSIVISFFGYTTNVMAEDNWHCCASPKSCQDISVPLSNYSQYPQNERLVRQRADVDFKCSVTYKCDLATVNIGKCPVPPPPITVPYYCIGNDGTCKDMGRVADFNTAKCPDKGFLTYPTKGTCAEAKREPTAPTTPTTPATADDQVGKLKDAALKDLNPGNLSGVTGLIGRAIQLLLAFIGSISIVLYVYAGILWMTAAGNSEQTGKAKQVIVWTTLGVVVMLSSYLIVSSVFKGLGL